MGGLFRQGIDYASLESVLRLQGFDQDRRAELFEDVRLIESGALEKINEVSG